MQKWYKGKRKVSLGERIKNFKVNGTAVDKALAFVVVLTTIALGAYAIKTVAETKKKSNNNIRVEENMGDVSYIDNSKELVKILCKVIK